MCCNVNVSITINCQSTNNILLQIDNEYNFTVSVRSILWFVGAFGIQSFIWPLWERIFQNGKCSGVLNSIVIISIINCSYFILADCQIAYDIFNNAGQRNSDNILTDCESSGGFSRNVNVYYCILTNLNVISENIKCQICLWDSEIGRFCLIKVCIITRIENSDVLVVSRFKAT